MRNLKTDLLKIADTLPTGDPVRREILAAITSTHKTAGHPARDIGPVAIEVVGKQLGVGNDWRKGAFYEAIGDAILENFRYGSGCLDDVVGQVKYQLSTGQIAY